MIKLARLIRRERGFCLELLPFRDHSNLIWLPGFLLSIYKGHHEKTFVKIGRLYKGYVGLYIITRWFELNVWILNYEKER